MIEVLKSKKILISGLAIFTLVIGVSIYWYVNYGNGVIEDGYTEKALPN